MIRWSMDKGHYRKEFKKDNGAEGDKNRGRKHRGKERPDIVTKNRKNRRKNEWTTMSMYGTLWNKYQVPVVYAKRMVS